ncbi:hypothetical protein BDV93DRAFT_559616 [Ceratobasidium sp. AG-I]|nr:hypothetical protein BDV93DRAFT_559616 [Ceratobasidium sp. AG-I]
MSDDLAALGHGLDLRVAVFLDSSNILQSPSMLTLGVRRLYQASVKIYIISEY